MLCSSPYVDDWYPNPCMSIPKVVTTFVPVKLISYLVLHTCLLYSALRPVLRLSDVCVFVICASLFFLLLLLGASFTSFFVSDVVDVSCFFGYPFWSLPCVYHRAVLNQKLWQLDPWYSWEHFHAWSSPFVRVYLSLDVWHFSLLTYYFFSASSVLVWAVYRVFVRSEWSIQIFSRLSYKFAHAHTKTHGVVVMKRKETSFPTTLCSAGNGASLLINLPTLRT